MQIPVGKLKKINSAVKTGKDRSEGP